MVKLSVEQAVEKAKKFEKASRYDEAVQIYRAILQSLPGNAKAKVGFDRARKKHEKFQSEVNTIIRLLYEKDFQSAESKCAKLRSTHSRSPILLNLHGISLQGAGDHVAAIAAFKQAIAIDNRFPDAHYNAGNSFNELGNTDEAIAAYKFAVELNPKYIDAINNLAVSLQNSGNIKEAVETYQKALDIEPNRSETHNNIGVLLNKQNQPIDALNAFHKAVSINPEYSVAYKNLGSTYNKLEQYESASEALQKAIELNPEFSRAFFELGNAYRNLGLTQKASDAYKASVTIDPQFAEGHRSLGGTLKNLGDIEGAESCFRQALEINPNFPSCLRNLSVVTKLDKSDPTVKTMLELAENDKLSDDERCHLNFALGYTFSNFGDYEKSAGYLIRANSIRRKILNYSIQEDIELFEKLKSTSAALQKINITDANKARPIPIFIVGMPRSGTTLLEQIISAHPDVSGAGELNYVGRLAHDLAIGENKPTYENLLEFRNNYLDALSEFSDGREYVSDKMPHNFRYAALIKSAIPEARMVHSVRDPGATCWSNFYQFFPASGLGYCYGLDTVVQYYKLYQNLMSFWDDELPNYLINVDYEHLTQNQESDTRKLIKALRLPWSDACLSPQENTRAIKTASAIQVREAVYTGSSQKWRRFEPYLDGAFDPLY